MKKFIGLLSSMCFFSQISLAHPDADQVRKSFTAAGVYSLQKEKSSQESPDLVALGRHLFFEKQLSGNKNISCATCHHPRFGTGDALPVSLGTGGTDIGPNRQKNSGHLIPRNAPPAFNLGFNSFHTTMWDGRIAKDAKTGALKTPDANLNGINPEAKEIAQQLTTVAAAQAMFPVTSAHEMRGDAGENEIADASTNLEAWKNLVIRLLGKNNGTVGGITKYKKMFQQAYPEVKNLDQINYGHVARAVAAYENFAFLADNSNFDKFLLGNDQALTSAQLRGAKLL